MSESLDGATAKRYVLAILEGPGMTVFTRRVKQDLVKHDMKSGDAVNVLRGGKMSAIAQTPGGWRYQATTRQMIVEFSFRGGEHGASGAPNELVIEEARRNKP